MGVKFASSVKNVFMDQGEEESVYKPPELLLYKRFIDDVIILWKGKRETNYIP